MGKRRTGEGKLMELSRRKFLKKAAGLSALLFGSKTAFELLLPGQVEAQYLPKPEALTAERWAMVVDMAKMDEDTIQKCVEACHRTHNVPDIAKENPRHIIKWIWTETYEHTFPGTEQEHVAESVKDRLFVVLCNQCDNPPCVRVCPTKATWQREDGIVMMDMHRCIGCRFCMAACPFGSRNFNWRDPRPFIKEKNPDYPTREIGVVEKCDFCVVRLAQGLMPACVEVSNGGLIFGDLADENSPVRKALRAHYSIRRKPYLGTDPQVYYIVDTF
jgi:molybdopterin-containing oxidoreductase family iron-sulfur binding subunit